MLHSRIEPWYYSPVDYEEIVATYQDLAREERVRVLEALKDQRDERTAHLLSQLLIKEEERAVKKEIRKLLFRLRTLGVNVEQVKSEKGSILRPLGRDKKQAGYLSSYADDLERIIALSYRSRRNLFLFVCGLERFGVGLERLSSILLEQGELEDMLEDLKDRPHLFFVEVSPSYAFFCLKEAARNSGRGMAELKRLAEFFPISQGDVKEPKDIYHLDEDGYFRASFDEVLDHKIFETLALDWDGIENDIKAFMEVVNPPIILPSYRTAERKEEFLRSLLKKEALQKRSAHLRRTLEDYAYLLFELGEIETFRRLLDILKREDLYERAVIHLVEDALLSRAGHSPIVSPHEAQLPE